jgi:hypothetical protein
MKYNIYKKYGVCRTSSVYNFIEREPVVFVVIKKPPVCSCSPPLWKLRSTHWSYLFVFHLHHICHTTARARTEVCPMKDAQLENRFLIRLICTIFYHFNVLSAKQTTKIWGVVLCFLSRLFSFNLTSLASPQLDSKWFYAVNLFSIVGCSNFNSI